MNQDQIAVLFRRSELEKRRQRRTALLQQLENEKDLEFEPLTPYEQRAHDIAVESVKRQQADYTVLTKGGYWTRLWRALWGRA